MCAQALPEGFYREEIVFTPEETDSFGRVRPDALAHRFQEIAAVHHGLSSGVGQEIAVTKGLLLALARTEKRISRLPAVGERVFLDTWVGRQSHRAVLAALPDRRRGRRGASLRRFDLGHHGYREPRAHQRSRLGRRFARHG